MIPQLVIEERPHAPTTLLDPLWCVKCTEGADRTEPKDQEELNRLPLAGGQTAGIGAVVADPLEIKKEGLMLRQTSVGHLPRLIHRESGLVDAHRLLDSFVHASVRSHPSDRL